MGVPLLRIDVTHPLLRMTTTLPQVAIDDKEARAEIGLKPLPQLMRERAQRARAAGLEGIAQIAKEGDRLAKVEQPNAIPEIAATKWSKSREVNIDIAPKQRPQLQLHRGQVRARLEPGRVKVWLPHLRGPGASLDVRA